MRLREFGQQVSEIAKANLGSKVQKNDGETNKKWIKKYGIQIHNVAWSYYFTNKLFISLYMYVCMYF